MEILSTMLGRGTFAALSMALCACVPSPPVDPVPDSAGFPLSSYEPQEIFRDCPYCPKMVKIPAGSFVMGTSADERGHWENEGPAHRVKISESFALGRFEVTFGEYDHFARATGRELPPDFGEGRGQRPVNNVSWTEAHAYCAWLGDRTGLSYRLPSEAEWEYAARAGTMSRYAFGDELSNQQANFRDENGKAVEVGSYAANAWGLHDMHGNLAEWVEDHWHSTYADAPADGSAWTIGPPGSERVFRGGSWNDGERDVRSTARYPFDPNAKGNVFGFRCARDQGQAG